MISIESGLPGHRAGCHCYQCKPWPVTYAVPKGSPIGFDPATFSIPARDPDVIVDRPAWRAAITGHQLVLHWLEGSL